MRKNYLLYVALLSLMVACQNETSTPKPEIEKPTTPKPEPGKPFELKFDTVISGDGFFYELIDANENVCNVSTVTIDAVEYDINDSDDFYSVMEVYTWPAGKVFRIWVNYLENGPDRQINVRGKYVNINITQKPVDKATYDKQNMVVDGNAQTLELSDKGFFNMNMAPTVLMQEQDSQKPAVVQAESETLVTVQGNWSKMYRYYPEGGTNGSDIKIELQENNTGESRVLAVHNNFSYKGQMMITQESL